jgi:hypothetical protein
VVARRAIDVPQYAIGVPQAVPTTEFPSKCEKNAHFAACEKDFAVTAGVFQSHLVDSEPGECDVQFD